MDYQILIMDNQITTIPADIDATAYGRDTIKGSLEINYALYTGGKIDAIINQAKLNKRISQKLQ